MKRYPRDFQPHRLYPKGVLVPVLDAQWAPVWGGPIREAPGDVDYIVRLTQRARDLPAYAESVTQYDLSCPDFSTPDPARTALVADAVLRAVSEGSRVYVCCDGGIGRTGTFLACLVVSDARFSADAAVQYVRDHYRSDAVETDEQVEFVDIVREAVRDLADARNADTAPQAPKPPSIWRRLIGIKG